MSVDFHITPSASTINDTWSAKGHYYNDNGTVLNVTDNGNFYLLQVSGSNSS
jgi:hypothetical protein